jgi:hypothetical protein
MRVKSMPSSAQRALRRTLDLTGLDRATAHAENKIEEMRKRALRASWLDLRSEAARRERSNALAVYNLSLRTHLHRIHKVETPEDPWELDGLHEQLHGRD